MASVLAFVDRRPEPEARRSPGTRRTGWPSARLIPSVLEWYYDENLLLLAAAHWLVYLQLVKMFLPKTVEDDWFLFLLGLVQVLVGGVMSQSDKVGVALFCLGPAGALGPDPVRPPPRGPPDEGGRRWAPASAVVADRSEPYRGLIDLPFAFSTARVAATTLALGGLIFLAMPRRTSMGSSQSTGAVGKHLTGFDDEVKLGQLGEILENDSLVMSVELFDRDRTTPGRPRRRHRVPLARREHGPVREGPLDPTRSSRPTATPSAIAERVDERAGSSAS